MSDGRNVDGAVDPVAAGGRWLQWRRGVRVRRSADHHGTARGLFTARQRPLNAHGRPLHATDRVTDARGGRDEAPGADRTGQLYEVVIDEDAIEHRAPRRDLSPSEAIRLAERGPVRPPRPAAGETHDDPGADRDP